MQAFGLDTGLKLSADLILHLHPGYSESGRRQVGCRCLRGAAIVSSFREQLGLTSCVGVCQSLWFEQLRFACDKLCTKIG